MKKKNKISKICALHYVKLGFRTVLFLSVLLAYIFDKMVLLTSSKILLGVVWVCFVTEMVLRFFPSRLESNGCQKQFACNYKPKGQEAPKGQPRCITALMLLVWLLPTAAVGVLYFAKIIDAGMLILLSVFLSVCDVLCILFFCPFQTWVMKNRCCTTCRIYNWDFAMMFSPLIFMPSIYTYSLLGCALLLLLRWEIGYRLHPERYCANTNAFLDCVNCEEKLCHHKKQLNGFLKKYKQRFFGDRK